MSGAIMLAAAVRAAAPGSGGEAAGFASRPLLLIAVMGALSLLPFALLMLTSFVRISVVLSILRSALGTPSVPPGPVLTGLALVLTIAVMWPTGARVLAALSPTLSVVAAAELEPAETVALLRDAADRGKEPLRDFLLQHADARDRTSFLGLARKGRPQEDRPTVTDRDFVVVVPAFITSELRRAFQIGFLLFIPFLVVDMVVANLLLALGMHMLSPTTVSLPLKLLLFVLADGWHLVVRGLWESYL